jgi:hypothetical protein
MCVLGTSDVAAPSDFEFYVLFIWVLGWIVITTKEPASSRWFGGLLEAGIVTLFAISIYFVIGIYGASSIILLVLVGNTARICSEVRKRRNSLDTKHRKNQNG